MNKTLHSLGGVYAVTRIRLQKCSVNGCSEKTRTAFVVPCLDIEPDGGPGFAAVAICPEHIEDTILRLDKV